MGFEIYGETLTPVRQRQGPSKIVADRESHFEGDLMVPSFGRVFPQGAVEPAMK
jgi:hypothetical protein